jgi:hypothetical protein
MFLALLLFRQRCYFLLSAISYQLSAISYQLSAISYQLSAISTGLLMVINQLNNHDNSLSTWLCDLLMPYSNFFLFSQVYVNAKCCNHLIIMKYRNSKQDYRYFDAVFCDSYGLLLINYFIKVRFTEI